MIRLLSFSASFCPLRISLRPTAAAALLLVCKPFFLWEFYAKFIFSNVTYAANLFLRNKDKRRLMESGSRSSRGFDEEDEDEEGTSKKVELTVRADRGNDQRSKHSAMEQRRRSKINERFQMLQELIPHGDQKRDKASFLLEVIEYIQFLQEKVQKYESSYPAWNDENTKSMPWVKVYFRSLWKDSLNNNQVPGDGTPDPSHAMRTGPAQGLMYSVDEGRVPNVQNLMESDMSADIPNKTMENLVDFTNNTSSGPISSQPNYASVDRGAGVTEPQPRLISDIDNMASQSQAQWLRPSCTADYNVSSDTLNEQDELAIDEGTINISTAYSHNVLNVLNQALENSGIDLSQSNISVQIKLGRRATRKEAATTSSAKDQEVGEPRVGSSIEESRRAPKRSKA